MRVIATQWPFKNEDMGKEICKNCYKMYYRTQKVQNST